MNKGARTSKSSLRSTKSVGAQQIPEDIYLPPLDVLILKIKHITVKEEEPPLFAVKVTFFDQLILSGTIKALGLRDSTEKAVTFLNGSMSYDPSDYEKMCLFADTPLIVTVFPLIRSKEPSISSKKSSTSPPASQKDSSKSGLGSLSKTEPSKADISCCNIDILPLFIEKNKMRVQKRLEPAVTPSVLARKSYDNLPLLTMEIKVDRFEDNEKHHKVLKAANYMKITLIASYNMPIPFDSELVYTAATKMPVSNENVSDHNVKQKLLARRLEQTPLGLNCHH